MKDRRSEWRGGPLAHRPRRSRSPLMSDRRQNKPQKRHFRPSGRSSTSGEWLQDHPLRRSDHGKELVQEHSLPTEQWPHHRRSLSPCDDGFRFQQEPLFPDHTSSNPSWRLPQSIKNREFSSQINEALPSSYLDIEGQHMPPQKSTFIDEGPSQQLYSNRLMDSSLLNSDRLRIGGGSVGVGIQDNGIYSSNGRHRDQYEGSTALSIQDKEIHPYRDCLRDQYDDMDRKQVYSRDLPFPKMPSSQLRTYISASSSSILKEDFNGLHHDHFPDEFATGIRRYPNDPLEHYSYQKVPQSDTLRHGLVDKSLVNDYDELRQRGLEDHRPRLQDDLYKKICHPPRMEVTSTTLKYNEEFMHKLDSPGRNLTERTFPNHQDSLYRDFSHDYHVVGAQKEFLTSSDNWHGSLGIKSSKDYDTMPFEEGFPSKKEYFPLPYGADHRNGRSLLPDHELDERRRIVSTHNRSHIDDLSDYNGERMGRRNYDIDGDIDEDDLGVVFVNDRHSSAQYGSERTWLTEGPAGVSLPKSIPSVHSRYRKFSHSISTSNASFKESTYKRHRSSGGASTMHAETDHGIHLKRRLKHLRSDFHISSSSAREDLLRSYKYKKRELHNRLGGQGGGTHKSDSNYGKDDPREDSEEFKQQVHKAFLRYSKLLNESPHSRRMYQNQGNAYSMLCSVCGSSSKEFVDTNSLVIHTYHSLKVGLKTEHLGFHKALCVLLGWNWRVPPDNSRAYQSIPAADAKAMRDDLLLWPPLVIIHNGLTGVSSTKDAEVVTTEGLEKILRDLGFGAGMTRVSLGKPLSPSIFTVKFMPTFSGLQEAQRLHNHFSDKKHGKQEFQQRSGSSGKASRDEAESHPEEVDDFTLYGYMAVAEDLGKVDQETKRRSVVKSRTDIQAIADAPLSAD